MLLVRLTTLLLCLAKGQAQVPVPRSIRYIGAGYNVLLGNPLGTLVGNGGLDPGILPDQRILSMTYDEANVQDNFQRPDQINYDFVPTCSLVTKKYVFWSSDSLQENMKDNVETIGDDVYFTNQAFTQSDLFVVLNTRMTKHGDVFYAQNDRCAIGSATHQAVHTDIQYQLSDRFAEAVRDLPLIYDEHIYEDFITTWGTDVVVKVEVGTERTYLHNMPRTYFGFYAAENCNTSVSHGNGHNGYKDSIEVNMNTFKDRCTSMFGRGFANLTTGSSEFNEPIAIGLVSIDHIVATSSLLVDDLHIRQDNIKTVLKQYASNNTNLRRASGASNVVRTAVSWPAGTYGLPRVTSCPSGRGYTWNTGWRYHDTEDRSPNNQWSNPYSLSGSYGRNNMYQYFCMKTSCCNGHGPWYWHWHLLGLLHWHGLSHWPAGQYCIFKKGSCPPGFHSGWIKWDDEDRRNGNRHSGSVPDGTYDRNTKIDYCCRQDAANNRPIYLPTDRPFALIQRTSTCPQVAGMACKHEWFYWDCEDKDNANAKGGVYPRDTGGTDNIKIHYCVYH